MFTIDADQLPRFMACNGSRIMGGEIPPMIKNDTVKEEGNAAHYMALQVLRGNHSVDELIDRRAPNGVYMTFEMSEHVTDYLKNLPSGSAEVETTYGNDVWCVRGRADHISAVGDTLRVSDFKYGWRVVEPENHWTLIWHAIGFINLTGFIPAWLEFVIFQPRPYHPAGPLRIWRINWDHFCKLQLELCSKLSNPSDELHTSDHCYKCRALTQCPAASKSGYNAIEASEFAFTDTISDIELSHMLDLLKRAKGMIDSRYDAFKELAEHRIKNGKIIDNYSLEQSQTNYFWKDFVTADLLRALTGMELTKAPELVSPAGAIKLGANKVIVDNLKTRSSTGLTLTRISATKKAEKIFGKGVK